MTVLQWDIIKQALKSDWSYSIHNFDKHKTPFCGAEGYIWSWTNVILTPEQWIDCIGSNQVKFGFVNVW